MVLAITGEIKRIVAARIPNRENQHVAAAAGAVVVASAIGVETVHGIAGARRHIGAVEALNGGDIMQQRRDGVVTVKLSAGIGFAPVAHQRILA